jgi:hypothetical protein
MHTFTTARRQECHAENGTGRDVRYGHAVAAPAVLSRSARALRRGECLWHLVYHIIAKSLVHLHLAHPKGIRCRQNTRDKPETIPRITLNVCRELSHTEHAQEAPSPLPLLPPPGADKLDAAACDDGRFKV